MSNNTKIPEGYVWNEQYQCYRNEDDKAVDENGKELVGFADPKFREKHQNKTGRPKGRNTTALQKAQDKIDELAYTTVENLRKIASNKWKELELSGPISATTMMNANKILLDKAIAQEKEKAEQEKADTEESLEEVYTPAAVVDFSSKKR